ncbi:hypothetical protein HPB52_006463 [Rhipicephalus sanguineus]|uniref:Uncharacterized protein n=1 Tax=Rhipicephalus sanguineus TaxID=34632 RepID=A0A9D4PCS3_RHISA|nr:hypothetical protein HPB52_006463 [Rhipicephalus sanguineus]
MAPGQAPAFTEEEGGWSTPKVRLEAYFQEQEIMDAAKQQALLVAALFNGIVKVLQGRCHPKSVNDLAIQRCHQASTEPLGATSQQNSSQLPVFHAHTGKISSLTLKEVEDFAIAAEVAAGNTQHMQKRASEVAGATNFVRLRKQMGYVVMNIGLSPPVAQPRTRQMTVVISEQCAIDAGNMAT